MLRSGKQITIKLKMFKSIFLTEFKCSFKHRFLSVSFYGENMHYNWIHMLIYFKSVIIELKIHLKCSFIFKSFNSLCLNKYKNKLYMHLLIISLKIKRFFSCLQIYIWNSKHNHSWEIKKKTFFIQNIGFHCILYFIFLKN